MNTLGHFRLPIDDCRLSPIANALNRQLAIGNRHQCLPIIGTSIADTNRSELGWPRNAAEAPNAKSAVAEPLAGTVTSIVFSVPLAPPSCQATTVYLPGGTPLIVKLPSSALTANK